MLTVEQGVLKPRHLWDKGHVGHELRLESLSESCDLLHIVKMPNFFTCQQGLRQRMVSYVAFCVRYIS